MKRGRPFKMKQAVVVLRPPAKAPRAQGKKGQHKEKKGPKGDRVNVGTSTRIKNCELVGELRGHYDFQTLSYVVNAGNPSLFPWLARLATSFEKYRFSHLKVKIKPVMGSQAPGFTAIAFDPDVRDRIPTSFVEMMGRKSCTQSQVSKELSLNLATGGERLVRDTDADVGAEGGGQQLYDCGTVHLSTTADGMSALTGLVYVDYDVTLTVPSLRSPLLVGSSVPEVLTSRHIGTASSDALLSDRDHRIVNDEDKEPMEAQTPLTLKRGLPAYNPSSYEGSTTALINSGDTPFSGTINMSSPQIGLASWGPFVRKTDGTAKGAVTNQIHYMPVVGTDSDGKAADTAGILTVRDLLPGEGISINWNSVRNAGELVLEVVEIAAPIVSALWNHLVRSHPYYNDGERVAKGLPALYGEAAVRALAASKDLQPGTAAVSVQATPRNI